MVSEPSQAGFMLVSPHQSSEAVGFPQKFPMKIASSGFIQSSGEGMKDPENMFMPRGKA